MQKPIILIKLGGSLITDKKRPFTVRRRALRAIAVEVKKVSELGIALIIGHGAGSFAHIPAQQYQTHKGCIRPDSKQGIVEVAAAARRLNSIVMEELVAAGVLAVSVSPLSMMTARNFQLGSISIESLEQLLSLGLIPVVYGDQVMDQKRGCTIFSTERVLGYIGLELQQHGQQVAKIIHCGQTDGVYDLEGKTIPVINNKNLHLYQQAIHGSDGVDVTGGMLHKVEESLLLANQGIPSLIIDGVEQGSLVQAVMGEAVLGTRVEQ